MPKATHSEGVPIDVWLPVSDETATGVAVRRWLAGRLIGAYSAQGGIVVDLAPGTGEVVAAASDSGRSVVLHAPPSPCSGRRSPRALQGIIGTADLVLSLPPPFHLGPLRPHGPSRPRAELLARHATGLLRPGGFFVLGILGGGRGADPVAATVEAATAAGLAYFQHVVALIQDRQGADDAEGVIDGSRHFAHADVLVFTRRAA